ncbi:LysR family transcriptional regulator [Herbaspirillum sp. LeCh32-8]|uniref:LysR family transcriptional regulator n=1 Tax=Herbaspirillum sp. LeCh32-8 TaxID=2821356 RepID=UPI001AE5BFB1|nr:LysR family transcriptional regulator [Herbaspirillum sp. LeCh32-8]MBP0596490.1 LysR family transcriptional regulator [Herbaspirillum sp. LeCh32-8]
MRKFDWDDLQAFLAVVRAGRLTVGARKLGVDHSTLSRRIAGLEQAIGATLFDRRSAGYVLTAEGERLVPDAEAMENLAIRIRSRQDDAAQGLAGSVRIGTPEAWGTYFLARELKALSRLHPELEVELVANPRMFSLSKREADLAVSMTRPEQGRLVARRLNDYELGVYAAPSYLEEHRALGAIAGRRDLERHRWVGYIEDLMWSSELDYLAEISPALRPHIRISNVISQVQAVAAGVGLGVLPCFLARREPGLVRLLPLEIRLTRSYWLLTHADARDLVRVQVVAEFITRRLAALGADFWMDAKGS